MVGTSGGTVVAVTNVDRNPAFLYWSSPICKLSITIYLAIKV